MTTTTNPTKPPTVPARPTLPKGLQWSNAWIVDGQIALNSDPDVKMPVNDRWEIAGQLWVCPVGDCAVTQWTFEPVDSGDAPCCTRHPARLILSRVDATDVNPELGAVGRAKTHVRSVYDRRKQQAVDAAQARLAQAQQAVADAARSTAADMRGHAPSIAVSVAVLGAGTYMELTVPGWAALVGVGAGSVGAVAAYLVAYWVRRMRAQNRADTKQARRDRAFARHVAGGTLAAGIWLVGSATLAALPDFFRALLTLLFGLLLTFAVNHAHWQELWATRHRLKDLDRRRAEAAARRAAEAARLAAEAPTSPTGAASAEIDESDPRMMGQRMAAEWKRIADSQSVTTQFPQMPRTWIHVEETREISVPDDNGNLVRIGWEYSGHAEPGVLVARPGAASPIVAARDWLAAVLFDGRYDASMISVVDRPGGNVNRFVITISERFPLGSAVGYKGRAGIRRASDGSLFGHIGRTLLGDEAERVLWVPGQAGGGGRYGVTGSGKSVVTQLSLLNDLYAGIFSMLWDGKNLMDFAEFIGIIPMGCTREHRDVMYRSIRAEMERRQQMLTLMEGRDRHGRPAPVEALWDPRRDGPPQRWTIEEFHLNARDDAFINSVTELTRLQRSSATMLEISTQGGGLADAGNSVLRDQLNQVAMQIMRMGDHQARLTGYAGDYMPSRLPRLPGMMLMVEADAPAIPVRAAYVHRRDEDGNIYDHLFDRNNNPILTAPALPAETLEVYEREGLMDLWRRGQGPGGKKRLLNDGPVSASTVNPSPLGQTAGQTMEVAEVLMAVLWHKPGSSRVEIDAHPAWAKTAAGARVPNPSTVSKAVTKLETLTKLLREGPRDRRTYRLTEKATADGERAYRALFGAPREETTDEEETD